MPAIFPDLRPEELLYSGIARFGDMMEFPSAEALWRNVYGECSMSVEVDLSGPLGSMVARMPSRSDYDTKSLLRKHTLFPYLTFSMPPQRRSEVEAKLTCKGSRPTGSVLRTANWAVKSPKNLRYCRVCVREDKNGPSGLAYWRRSHQLPGVLLCPTHQEGLVVSSLLRPVGNGPREFVSLERALELGEERAVELPSRFVGSALQIAKDSLWLLQNPDVADGTLLQRQREWQLAHGWQHEKSPHRGNFNFKDFLSAIRNHYDEEFLRALCEGDTSLLISKTGGWIRQITIPGNMDRAYHPLQHILLWRFLGLTVGEFFQDPGKPVISPEPTKSKSRLTLKGPCLNVACDQYEPPVPRILDVQEEDKNKRFTIFCPVCDFTYTQRPSCDDPRRIRIKNTGDLWDSRIRELLKRTPTLSLEKLTHEIGFSQGTIQKHALRLNLWRPRWKESAKQAVDSAGKSRRRKKAARHRNRQKWLKLRKEFPDESRSELRKRAPRVGYYLSKHDTDWYNAYSPRKRGNWSRRRRKRWQKLDETTLATTKEKVAEMLHEDPPVRITLHGLSVRLGQVSTLQTRLRRKKLPQTEEFIGKVTEDRRDYALRRLCNVINHYAQQKELPAYREFTNEAAMDHRSYPELATAAYAALKAHIDHKKSIPGQWKASDPEIKEQA